LSMQEQRTTLRNGVLRLFVFRKWCQKPTLQQNLSQEQAHISKCGDNPRLMTAPSAYMTPIQKTKYYIGKQCLMPSKFSNIRMMRAKELFNVRFTGHQYWKLHNNEFCNNSRIYEYIPPVNGFHKEIMNP
jgi:hypothetical protein